MLYDAGGDAGCVDVDECRTETCPGTAECVNLSGSYECVCPQGYIGNGWKGQCADEDEWVVGRNERITFKK